MKYFGSIITSAMVMALCLVGASAQQTAPRVIHGGILNGKAVSLPKPEYPDEAKSVGIEGTVRVQITIDENGNVESAEAMKDETSDIDGTDVKAPLKEAAERAALAARFTPTLLSGQPVKVIGTIVYNFTLSEKTNENPSVVDGGILNSRAVKLPRADYPAAAKAVKASGIVVVQVAIDEKGDVISAKAVSGHPLLQSSAVSAAREAKFLPVKLSGQPVRVSGVITYNFILPDRKQ